VSTTVRTKISRLRLVLAALAFMAGTFGVTAAAVVTGEQPAAASGERAAILFPFSGNTWLSGDGPGVHHHFWNAWSEDLHAPVGTAVKARFASSDGTVTLSVASVGATCAAPNSAGSNVTVNVYVNGAHVGEVIYGHLNNVQVSAGQTILVDATLGYLNNWTWSSCWQDNTSDGVVHTHIEVEKGCYRNLASWTGYPSGAPIGLLKSAFASSNVSACDEAEVGQVASGQPAGDGTPATVARTSNNLDVFFRNSSNNLVARYWDSSIGWNATALVADGTVRGDPAVVSRTSGSMDVFYRNSSNNLVALSWNASTGWSTSTLITNGTVEGNPAVVARSANNMDVFFRSTTGSLVDVTWDSSVGWGLASWALNVKGDPAAISRTSSTINVFFRNTSNNLIAHYWDASVGWNNGVLIGDGTVAGDPAAVARTSGNMEVFYRNSNNNLVDAYWSSATGWASAAWADALASDPAVVARTSGNLDVFFRNSSNQLVDRYWDASVGWNTAAWNLSMAGNPAAVNRGSANMDVFFINSSVGLVDQYWSSSLGWNTVSW
jgi:hypothetical protein